MRRTAILMLILSVFLGVLAVYLARDWVQEQVTAANKVETKQVNLTTVVVAKRPLHFGDELSGSSVEEVSWPSNNVPPGSFSTVSELLGKGERRVVLRSIQLNEPVLKNKVSGFGGRATLSTVIDKGLRAVTVRVNDVNGVAGFVLPGDHVDILLTRQLKGANEQITDVLMQNIKVLGIDQDAAEDKDKPKVVRAVTLEVEVEQSQKLTLAQMVGQLALSLRSATNNNPIAHRRIRERDLVDDRLVKDTVISTDTTAKPAKKVVQARPVNTLTSVKVYRGLTPKVHEVTSEAATHARGAATSSTLPRRLVPKGAAVPSQKAAPGQKKDTVDTGGSTPPVSSAPVPLLPDASKPRNVPMSDSRIIRPITPGSEKSRMPKTGDPTVTIYKTRPLALKQGSAR